MSTVKRFNRPTKAIAAVARPHAMAKSSNELMTEMHRSHQFETQVWVLLALSASLVLALSFQF